MSNPLDIQQGVANDSPAGWERSGVEPVYHGLRIAFGLLFLCGGLFIYYSILTSISGVLSGTLTYPIVDKFLSPEARVISLPRTGEQITLPPVFFTGMGYGVIAFFGWIAASIGNTLIRSGTALIQPDARALIRKLRGELIQKTGR